MKCSSTNIIKDKEFIYNLFGLQPNDNLGINLWVIPSLLLESKFSRYSYYKNDDFQLSSEDSASLPNGFDLVILRHSDVIKLCINFKNTLTIDSLYRDGYLILKYSYNHIVVGGESMGCIGKIMKYTMLIEILSEEISKIIAEKLSNSEPIGIITKPEELQHKASNMIKPSSDQSVSSQQNELANKYSLIKDLILENEKLNEKLSERDIRIQQLDTRIGEQNNMIDVLSDKIIAMKELTKNYATRFIF